MIRCPECSCPIEIARRQQPLKKITSTEESHAFRLCWTVGAPTCCPKCNAIIPIEFFEGALPEEIPISEGAALMSSRNKRRFNPDRAKKAAIKRWAKDG